MWEVVHGGGRGGDLKDAGGDVLPGAGPQQVQLGLGRARRRRRRYRNGRRVQVWRALEKQSSLIMSLTHCKIA